MGTKYSTNSASGYNSTPPSDDGTVSEANKVKYSTIKTKLGDPVKDLADTINSELVTHFNNGPNAYTSNQTLGAGNYNTVNQVSGSGVTLTLTDASTLGAGWYCEIVNTDTSNTVSLARATASNMINETSADVTIQPLSHLKVIVNAAANGFLVTDAARSTKTYKPTSVIQMPSKAIWSAEGANVASASDCNIWSAGDGNTAHITGTTSPSDWGTAPQAGASMWCTNDSALTLTYNATTNVLPGDADIALPANSWFEVYAKSTSTYEVRNILFSDGRSLGSVAVSPIATTSGTSVEISSTVPPWAKKIIIMLNGVSTNGTNNILIQVGDSGGYETTGYNGRASYVDAGNNTAADSTGMIISVVQTAASTLYGIVILSLDDSSTFRWSYMSNLSNLAGGWMNFSAGNKSLSAALDRIRITSVGTTDTFDAGTVSARFYP